MKTLSIILTLSALLASAGTVAAAPKAPAGAQEALPNARLTGEAPPALNPAAIGWTVMGAWAQIAGTALMLLLMKSRAFGVATAWLKTEPVLVALLGVAFLGDHLTVGMLAPDAIIASNRPLASTGVTGTIPTVSVVALSSSPYAGAMCTMPVPSSVVTKSPRST